MKCYSISSHIALTRILAAEMCQQVRTGPGVDSLLLCHADKQFASDKESRSVVTLSPLSQEIAEGTAKLHS